MSKSEAVVVGQNGTMVAAERRRRIYDIALQDRVVSVSKLAKALDVVDETIRRDLDLLHKEGKIVRSYGGAVIKDPGTVLPPYSQSRNSRLQEKNWIGAAAARYVPAFGKIFINSGSTTYQLAIRIPESRNLDVMTSSPEIVAHIAMKQVAMVSILGGRVYPDSMSSDCTLSEHVIDTMYWDLSFVGVEAINVKEGLMTVDLVPAQITRKILEHSRKAIVLADSSKFSRFSNAAIGPVTLMDVLITDSGINRDTVDELTDKGIEVVIARPDGESGP